MKQTVFIASVFLIGATTLGYAAQAVAPPASVLSNTQLQLQQARQAIEQIKLKREKLLAQLHVLEKKIGLDMNSMRELHLQIGHKVQHLKHLSKAMQTQQILLIEQQQALAKQVKSAFMMGKREQLRLLLNQQNPALASRMLIYYEYLNRTRLEKLAELQASFAHLQALGQKKRQESAALKKIGALHQTAEEALNQTQKQREQVLLALKQAMSQQIDELSETEQQTQAFIEKLLMRQKQEDAQPVDMDGNPLDASTADPLQHTSFVAAKGHLAWPVRGAILQKFGSPRSETQWDGVLIAAKEGTDIRAVSDGKVAFSDWMKGYGWLIILNHGEGYMSLYAFNQAVYKKVGEHVEAGAVIGAVGNSGGRGESALYFGIRNNGKPIDPASWCK